jgi:hypothetical protein
MDLPVLLIFFVVRSWIVPKRVAKEKARNNSSSILSRDKWFFIHSTTIEALLIGPRATDCLGSEVDQAKEGQVKVLGP